MNISIALLAFILFIAPIELVKGQRQASCCQEYCFDSDTERVQVGHFGTKTPYTIAKGPVSGRQFLVPNCNPTKLWMMIRNGITLPEANKLDRLRGLEDLRVEIVGNYEKRFSRPKTGELCDNDFDSLKRWRWDQNVTDAIEEFLTVEGWNEIKYLAIRYRRTFPNLLEYNYNQQNILFRHSNTQRTEASYKAFVEGLYGPNAYDYTQAQPHTVNDTLSSDNDFCTAPEVKSNDGKSGEYEKFMDSQVIRQTVSDISQRLGFRYPLKTEQILDMYDMCRYDQAWHLEKPSPWCAAFTPDQINDLEYSEDLLHYYDTGYGMKMNSKAHCSTINDMIHHISSNDQPKVITYFTHSSNLMLFLNAMKVAQDSNLLRADNYFSMSRRKWRTSEVMPSAANFAAVKYDCPNDVEREKVMFFLNEKLINFDWCKVGLCDLSDVKDRFRKYTGATSAASFMNTGTTAILLITLVALFSFSRD